jgi:hypothetical protein
MAEKLDVKKVALTLGIVFAAWHIGWALAIAVLGSGFLNWVMGLHFISMVVPIAPFDIVTLLIGAISAFLCGAITGAIFVFVWNKL